MRGALLLPLALLVTPAHADARYALGVVIAGSKGTVRAKDGIHLGANVSWQGPKAKFRYSWSSVDGAEIPGSVDASGPKLFVPADELTPGESYRIRIRVVASFVGKGEDGEEAPQQTEATSEVDIAVNAPPSGGKCNMAVEWVGKAGARLSLEAPGWSDDEPIQYRWELL